MKRIFMVALLWAVIVPVTANAADVTLYDNTTASIDTWDQVYWYVIGDGSAGLSSQWVASRFSTGDFSGTLSSVVLLVDGRVVVSLYTDNQGKPGNGLANLPAYSSSGSSDPSFSSVTFDGNGISLSPNTTYWVVLGAEGTNLYQPGDHYEAYWADTHDTTSPRALLRNSDTSYQWTETGSSYVPMMRVIGSTTTANTAPVADAGPDQAIQEIGTTVFLDGSQSYDADGDTLTYSWAFTSKPASSNATLSGDTTSTPSFVADVQGTYVIQLTVSDPFVASTETVTVSFNNVKPVANSGTGQVATVGDLVTVDGSGSSDANFDPLTYQWSFATMPANSLATFANPTAVQTTFVPDQPGRYGVQLIVNDGFVDSEPSTVQIQVTAVVDDTLLTLVRDEISLIGFLDPLVFQNRNLQNALINKLQAVLSAIQSEDYEGALRNLQNDVIGKTDGCILSGAPDKNDWIVTCEAQQQVYTNLIQIINTLTNY
jgi:hypothetical protein